MNPNPDYNVTYRVESHDWSQFLDYGKRYQLRQSLEIFNSYQFDVYYDFTYNGILTQNGHSSIDTQSWLLTNRVTLRDDTGITWDTNDTILFWLPFYQGMQGKVLTACGGFSYDTSGCSAFPPSTDRRFGNAGIIGISGDTNDPAISWLPHTNNIDLAFVHQDSGKIGHSADKMVGKYWIRELNITSEIGLNFVGGQNSTDNTFGVYGTKGIAALTNWPGRRIDAGTLVDSQGNLWLFGGSFDSISSDGFGKFFFIFLKLIKRDC